MRNKIEAICRICLRFGSEVESTCQSLFESHNSGSTILDKLTTIANIKIQEGDGLPNKICVKCLKELDAAIEFKEKCESSNKLLHDASEIKQLKLSTSPIAEVPIPIELVKKEDAYEDDLQYEEIEYLDNTELFIPSELEIRHDTDKTDTEVALEIKPEAELGASEDIPIESHEPIEKKSKAVDLKLKCHDCGGSFKSKCKLRVHWKKVHMSENLICHFCKRTFKSPSSLQNHLKKRPQNCFLASKTKIEGVGKSRVFYCTYCNFQSTRSHCFFNHLNIHTGDRPFACKLCQKSFSQQSSLQTHMETVHKMIKKQITCQYCGELVKGRSKISRHLRRHTFRPIQCDICKKMYKSKSTMIEHLKLHSEVKAFSCEVCAASFYTYTTLHNHKQRAHTSNRKKHKCDICGVNYVYKSSLQQHIAKHAVFDVFCKVCGKFFMNTEDLTSHQKIHTKEKSVCLECNRTFCNERSLKRHRATTHKHKKNLLGNNNIKKNCSIKTSKKCKDEMVDVEIFPLH